MTRKRRGRGEGSIFQRGDGTWCAYVSIGTVGKKTRRRYVYGKTRQEVQTKLRQLHQAIDAGAVAEPNRIKLGDLIDRWMAHCTAAGEEGSTFGESTRVRYASTIENHIRPSLGTAMVSKLTTFQLDAFLADLAKAGVRGRTRQIVYTILKCAMKQAVAWGMRATNPMDNVEKPKHRTSKPELWDHAQALAFLSACEGDRLEALYVLSMTTGARQAELLGLPWCNVNLEAETMKIERQLIELRGKMSFAPPKTEAGVRTISLPPVAVAALREHRKRMFQEGLTAAELVFVDTAGNPLRKSNLLRRSFFPLIAKANVPRIRWHSMRHVHTTLLLETGTPIKAVSERLGHANIQVTLQVYAHKIREVERGTAGAMEQLFGDPAKTSKRR